MITRYTIPPPPRFVPSDVQCSHTPVLCRRVVGKTTHFWEYCSTCGKELRRLKHTNVTLDQQRTAITYTIELRQSWYQNGRRQEEHLREAARQAYRDWYYGYLDSDVWAGKRKLVVTRAQGMCECCAVAKAEVVHHLTYEHVGQEPLWDLKAVCRGCHDWLHDHVVDDDDDAEEVDYDDVPPLLESDIEDSDTEYETALRAQRSKLDRLAYGVFDEKLSIVQDNEGDAWSVNIYRPEDDLPDDDGDHHNPANCMECGESFAVWEMYLGDFSTPLHVGCFDRYHYGKQD